MGPIVLAIGGSDPTAGAGIQADLKTIEALGGLALTAITSVTVQDSADFRHGHDLPAAVVSAQIEILLGDFPVQAVKTGMLATGEIVSTVAAALARRGLPLVVDPVLASSGGRPLLDAAGFDALVTRLLPLATLCTPNWPEAEALAARPVRTIEEAVEAGQAILALGVKAVLVTGGHAQGDETVDILIHAAGHRVFREAKIRMAGFGTDAHGTGCALASAIAVGLGAGMTLEASVEQARRFVRGAIRSALLVGQKRPMLNHFHEKG